MDTTEGLSGVVGVPWLSCVSTTPVAVAPAAAVQPGAAPCAMGRLTDAEVQTPPEQDAVDACAARPIGSPALGASWSAHEAPMSVTPPTRERVSAHRARATPRRSRLWTVPV